MVETSEPVTKQQIIEALKHDMNSLLLNANDFPILEQSDDSDYICRTTTYEGNVLTLATVTAKGITMQEVEDFFDIKTFTENMKLLNDIVTW